MCAFPTFSAASTIARAPYGDDDDERASSFDVIVPGQVIDMAAGYVRGHGTYVRNENLVASQRGVVQMVNKLVRVESLSKRYYGDVGDVVVGRILEVANKRWRVDINAPQDGIILLASVNLPGGEQRRKQHSDALIMRTLFSENDLVSAEVKEESHDGSLALHTRSYRYGKLPYGMLVEVPSSLVKRTKKHFYNVTGLDVGVILGCNGWIHIGPPHSEVAASNIHESEAPEETRQRDVRELVTPSVRRNIARVAQAIRLLSSKFIIISADSISDVVQASLRMEIEPMHMLAAGPHQSQLLADAQRRYYSK